MFIKVGNVQVTCIKNCDPCPMRTSPVDWKKLTEAPCCENMWVPARFRSQATAENKVVDKSKAMKLFLKDLGVL